jgi:hypothetical protein
VKPVIALGLLVVAAGCSGPAASDAALCQDVLHRLCLAPVCPIVATQLAVDSDCEETLLARTGCGDPGFVFTAPTRDRWLSCRAPLVRDGDHTDDQPTCDEVEETLSCPDVEQFLNGGTP